jgi:transcription elongation factor GreA
MDYITAEDRDRIRAQLDECIAKRRVLSRRIEEARALGDLRENSEYHAAREDQGLNEARIRELEARLSGAIVTSAADMPDGVVFVGALVRLRDVESGDEDTYRLVGDSRVAHGDDVIEVTPQSPMGQALMKARVGETVRVDLRRGPRRFEVIEIMR